MCRSGFPVPFSAAAAGFFAGLFFRYGFFYLCRMTTELCAYSVEACRLPAVRVSRAWNCVPPLTRAARPLRLPPSVWRAVSEVAAQRDGASPRRGFPLFRYRIPPNARRGALRPRMWRRRRGLRRAHPPDGRVDVQRTAALVAEAGPMQTTFHRAFDMACDLEEALRSGGGCRMPPDPDLGGRNTAVEGIDTLRALVAQAAGRIELMAGSGVNPSNAAAGGHGRRCRAF